VGISRRLIRAVGVASGGSVACYRLLKVSLTRGTIPSVTPQAARQLPLLRGAFASAKSLTLRTAGCPRNGGIVGFADRGVEPHRKILSHKEPRSTLLFILWNKLSQNIIQIIAYTTEISPDQAVGDPDDA